MVAGGASSGLVGNDLTMLVLARIWGKGGLPKDAFPIPCSHLGLMSSFWYNCRGKIPPKLCLLTLKSSCVNLLPNIRNEPVWPQSCLPCHRASGCTGGITPHPASVGCLNPMPHLVAHELTAVFFPVPLPLSISLANLAGNRIILLILLKTPELPKIGCKPKEYKG